MIIFISFYTGLGCFILFQIADVFTDSCNNVKESCFSIENDFDNRSISEKIIVMAYFSFTTLSTVGFGDYYAISSGERLVMCVIMLLGIMCFSYIMGLFTEIMLTFTTINNPIEEYYALDLFVVVLASFN